ncbi:MAG: glycosyl hydrolase [Candidatus Bathyarchaeia archaeon]
MNEKALPWAYIKPFEKVDKEIFKSPPVNFSPIPFWFWNDEMDEEKISWEIKEFKDKGINSFCIHGRYGLKVPYLSDEWFRKVKFALEEAKRLGAKVWIYDEYNWPSGTAGLQVPKKFPEFKGKVLEAIIWRFKGPIFLYTTLGDSRYMNLEGGKLFRAIAFHPSEIENLPKNVIDITRNLSFGEAVSWESPKDDIVFMMFIERIIDWYIDPFNPDAVKKFIELTHERYYKFVGSEFGSNILGFYTDEPAYYYYRTGDDIPAIPWSKNFPRDFLREKGYDIGDYLPFLFLDVGEISAKIRCDFWDFITRKYAENFYKRIRDWCHEHSVLFTGHLLFEDDLRRHVRCEGNIFEHLKYFDIIGVDHLYPRIGSAENPEEHVAPKIASSAAHHYGSPRVLCESFGGIYWNANFARMKWITDWEYVLGIDLLNPHGFHYSIEGDRKRDWPPSQFYHHPFWKYYRRFAEYVSRLSYMLSGGKHVANVLFLFPIISAWANYIPQKRTTLFDIIERDFYYLTDMLLRIHWDYDYVDENILRDAEIIGDKIKIKEEFYDVLLLPPITTIKTSTMEKIKNFYNSGGKILAGILLPFQSAEKGYDEEVIKNFRDLFGVDPLEVSSEIIKCISMKRKRYAIKAIKRKNKRGGCAYFIKATAPLSAIKPSKLIDKLLSEMSKADVKIDDPEILCLHKVKDGVDIFFIVNPSEVTRNFTLSLRSRGKPEIWDPENGSVETLWIYQIENNGVKIPLTLHGYGSKFIVLKANEEEPHITDTNIKVERVEKDGDKIRIIAYAERACNAYIEISWKNLKEKLFLGMLEGPKIIELPTKWKFKIIGENAFLIDFWKVKMDDEEERGFKEGWYKPEYDESGWLSLNCGPLSAYFSEAPRALWYKSRFNVEGGKVRKILLDGVEGDAFRLFINGEEINVRGPSSILDVNITEVDISDKVRLGENVIAILIKPSSLKDGLLDPIRILGEFKVTEKECKISLDPLHNEIVVGKSWTEQGFPYYSGTIIYETEIEIPSLTSDKKVLLDCGDVRDVLEVVVNNESCGIRLWQPYIIDVTRNLKSGRNKIELKVTNTAANIIKGEKVPSGLLSPPKLIMYDLHEISLGYNDFKGMTNHND